MFCNKCGRMLPDGATFCGDCGSRQDGSDSSSSQVKEPVSLSVQPTSNPAPTQPQVQPMQSYQQNSYQQPQGDYHQNEYQNPRAAQPFANGQYPVNDYQSNQEKYLNSIPTVGEYIGTFLLMCLPIVNIVMLFVWAFSSSTKRAIKNFARAQLIISAVILGLYLLLIVVFAGALIPFLNEARSIY